MSFVDAEAVVRDFLTDVLDVPVVVKVPNPRPARFVRVWRSGGSAVHRALDVPHITVTAWAADTVDAVDLANAARDALFNESSGMSLVRGVSEVGGVHYDEDLDTGTPRYTFTISLRVRAAR